MTHQPVVLVGVDGSDAGMGAVDWAAAEARQRGWALHLVCAYSLPSFAASTIDGGFAAIDDDRIRSSAAEVLKSACERVPEGIEVTTSVENGDPTTVLADMSNDVARVVIGKRRGAGLADRILGAVSSALPPHARCPTVVVPYDPNPSRERLPIRRIVVGIDGSEAAALALKSALREARVWEAELTVVGAVPLGATGAAFGWGAPAIDPDELLAEVQRSLESTVARVSEEMGELAAGVQATCHALGGSGAALLTEFSTAVDLVVVGTRGRGGFTGLMLGSTSQTVIQHSTAPVLVVPVKKASFAPFEGNFPWEVG